MKLAELLSYLADPESRRLFASDDPEEYLLLDEYLGDLEAACVEVEERGGELPDRMPELIQLLREVLADTDVRAVYNEGRTMYTDSTGRVVDDPHARWVDYVNTSPKWARAVELAESMGP